MLGLSILKIPLAALLAEMAVKKSTEEITKNKTSSGGLHFAGHLGITPEFSLAFNGDVAVIVNNYQCDISHLPGEFTAARLEPESEVWFRFEDLKSLAKLLIKSKSAETQQIDANLCHNAAGSQEHHLVAFNDSEVNQALNNNPPAPLNVVETVRNFRQEKEEAVATMIVNLRDLERLCCYLRKVGGEFAELKIANHGQRLIFTVRHPEEGTQAEGYQRIRWKK